MNTQTPAKPAVVFARLPGGHEFDLDFACKTVEQAMEKNQNPAVRLVPAAERAAGMVIEWLSETEEGKAYHAAAIPVNARYVAETLERHAAAQAEIDAQAAQAAEKKAAEDATRVIRHAAARAALDAEDATKAAAKQADQDEKSGRQGKKSKEGTKPFMDSSPRGGAPMTGLRGIGRRLETQRAAQANLAAQAKASQVDATAP